MGSGAVFSIRFGQQDDDGLKEGMFASFVLIAALAVLLNAVTALCTDEIILFLQVPAEIRELMHGYLTVIFWWNCRVLSL